jgi:signal peptidase I
LKRSALWSHLKSLISTVAFVWLFTNHVAQATMVPSESMEPTILVGDHFMLDKVAFPANYPELMRPYLPERALSRGDIVAFWSPEDPNRRLIKRALGLPGEVFEIRSGDVYINGTRLSEPYAVHSRPTSVRQNENLGPFTIPPNAFFMMGDNRDNSRDSRYIGLVRRDSLIGKPLFIYWSYDSGPYAEDRTL